MEVVLWAANDSKQNIPLLDFISEYWWEYRCPLLH
jgi:hypothetical protein